MSLLDDYKIIVSTGVPENEIRFIDMTAVTKKIAILDEPRPITVSNKIVGDTIEVAASQPAMRFVNRETGQIITPKLSANSQPPPKG